MTAKELMNLMTDYPNYEVVAFSYDYNFYDNCSHDCAHPELLIFYVIDWYVNENTKEIVLELKQE